jgi:excisionase family DNA binding protein
MSMSTNNNTPNQFLSLKKAANLLDMSVSTLRRLLKGGELHAYKFGGQIRISTSDLHAFIAGSSL